MNLKKAISGSLAILALAISITPTAMAAESSVTSTWIGAEPHYEGIFSISGSSIQGGG